MASPAAALRPRLDVDGPWPRQVDVVDLGDPSGAGRHDGDAIGEEDRLGDGVGDEGDGLSGLHPDLLDEKVHFIARECVEGAEGLVHQKHRGIDRQASHDRGALLHAARQLPRKLVLETRQADAVEELVDPLPFRRLALDLEGQLDVLLEISPGQEVGILEDHRDFGMRLRHGLVAQHDGAARKRMEPGHRPQQGGLAAAGRSEDAQELALAHIERDIVDGVNGAGTRLIELGCVADRHLDLVRLRGRREFRLRIHVRSATSVAVRAVPGHRNDKQGPDAPTGKIM